MCLFSINLVCENCLIWIVVNQEYLYLNQMNAHDINLKQLNELQELKQRASLIILIAIQSQLIYNNLEIGMNDKTSSKSLVKNQQKRKRPLNYYQIIDSPLLKDGLSTLTIQNVQTLQSSMLPTLLSTVSVNKSNVQSDKNFSTLNPQSVIKTRKIFKLNNSQTKTSKKFNPLDQSYRSAQKMVQRVLRNNKFIYIDINQKNGFKVMQKCDPQDSDQEIQKLGRNYVSNLSGLSKQNQKINLYLAKIKQLTQKKQTIRGKIKNQLDKSQQRIDNVDKLKSNHRKDNSWIKGNKTIQQSGKGERNIDQQQREVFRAMDTIKMKHFMQMKQLRELNQQIVEKQRKLVSKFGIVADYKSISVQENDRKKYPPIKHLSPISDKKKYHTIDHEHQSNKQRHRCQKCSKNN